MGKSSPSSRCYFKVKIGEKDVGQIVIQLFDKECPKTCENFRKLCSGDAGTGRETGKKLHYLNSTFHRVVSGFMIQGGDFTKHDGTGGESIYGGTFSDENLELRHDEPYLLSMANKGKNTNGSQFFITCAKASHLDGKHVVFGKVIEGQDVVKEIEKTPITNAQTHRPVQKVLIYDCGELIPVKKSVEKKKKKRKASSSSSSSSSSEKEDKEDEKNSEDDDPEVPNKRRKKSRVRPEEIPPTPSNKFLDRGGREEYNNYDEDEDDSKFTGQRRYRSNLKVRGRGNLRYSEDTRSRTPPHWQAAEKNKHKMTREDWVKWYEEMGRRRKLKERQVKSIRKANSSDESEPEKSDDDKDQESLASKKLKAEKKKKRRKNDSSHSSDSESDDSRHRKKKNVTDSENSSDSEKSKPHSKSKSKKHSKRRKHHSSSSSTKKSLKSKQTSESSSEASRHEHTGDESCSSSSSSEEEIVIIRKSKKKGDNKKHSKRKQSSGSEHVVKSKKKTKKVIDTQNSDESQDDSRSKTDSRVSKSTRKSSKHSHQSDSHVNSDFSQSEQPALLENEVNKPFEETLSYACPELPPTMAMSKNEGETVDKEPTQSKPEISEEAKEIEENVKNEAPSEESMEKKLNFDVEIDEKCIEKLKKTDPNSDMDQESTNSNDSLIFTDKPPKKKVIKIEAISHRVDYDDEEVGDVQIQEMNQTKDSPEVVDQNPPIKETETEKESIILEETKTEPLECEVKDSTESNKEDKPKKTLLPCPKVEIPVEPKESEPVTEVTSEKPITPKNESPTKSHETPDDTQIGGNDDNSDSGAPNKCDKWSIEDDDDLPLTKTKPTSELAEKRKAAIKKLALKASTDKVEHTSALSRLRNLKQDDEGEKKAREERLKIIKDDHVHSKKDKKEHESKTEEVDSLSGDSKHSSSRSSSRSSSSKSRSSSSSSSSGSSRRRSKKKKKHSKSSHRSRSGKTKKTKKRKRATSTSSSYYRKRMRSPLSSSGSSRSRSRKTRRRRRSSSYSSGSSSSRSYSSSSRSSYTSTSSGSYSSRSSR